MDALPDHFMVWDFLLLFEEEYVQTSYIINAQNSKLNFLLDKISPKKNIN
jgi:hypothetical protein